MFRANVYRGVGGLPTFEFGDCLTLAIAGQVFDVVCGPGLKEKAEAHRVALAETIMDVPERRTVDSAIEVCRGLTDNLLGTGAFGRIFADRVPRLPDCAEVLAFVTQEVIDHLEMLEAMDDDY